MTDRSDRTRNDADEFMKKALDSELPKDVEARMKAQFASFRRDLLSRRPPAFHWRSRAFRMATAMACALLLITAGNRLLSRGMPPTWAEVGERFASVPFFGATVYVKNGPTSEPIQFDLWMNKGGLLRLHAGNQVMFGKDGAITDTVKLPGPDTPPEAMQYGRELIESVAKSLANVESFSLDSFVRALPSKAILSAPRYNEEASIARDLIVYDIVNTKGPDWIRIWALRESRLPVRVLFWSPEEGCNVDAVLAYSNEQPVEFFNPERFRESLKNADGATGQAYLLLKDPGGRPVTPGDIQKSQ